MYRIEPWNDRAAALAFFEQHEPATTPQAAILTHQDVGRTARVWRAIDADGTVGGALLVHRRVRDRWDAYPVLIDSDAVDVLAPVIDGSPARQVFGRGDHVVPFAPLMSRLRNSLVLPWTATEAPFPFLGDPDARVRMGVPADLDALVDLFSGYEIDDIPTRPRWRSYLGPLVERGQLSVVDDAGSLLGALAIPFASRRWWFAGSLTVLPEARGQNLGWELIKHGIVHVQEHAPHVVGAIVSQAVTNPMQGTSVEAFLDQWFAENPERSRRGPIDVTDVGLDETLAQLSLRPQVRFPGHARARRAVELIEGATRKRTPELVRPVTRVEDLGTD